ncbi:hypothetical protein FHQ22_09845, partial [Pasteurellaceae bacterium Phil31]
MNTSHINSVLSTPSIGLFTCIELFEIIGIQDKKAFNIFTLAIAQEVKCEQATDEKITPKFIQLKKDKSLQFGIFRSVLSIGDFIDKIKYLENNQWQNNQGKPLLCGQLRYIPSVYVPALE